MCRSKDMQDWTMDMVEAQYNEWLDEDGVEEYEPYVCPNCGIGGLILVNWVESHEQHPDASVDIKFSAWADLMECEHCHSKFVVSRATMTGADVPRRKQ